MGKIDEAVKLAMGEFKKEYGQDAELQEGNEFITVFNDGVVTISMKRSKVNVKILLGEPYRVDFNIRS